LPPEKRFCQENILLPVISRACVYKKYGMGRVLSGIDEDGTRHLTEQNYAADMREADEGRSPPHPLILVTAYDLLLTTYYLRLTTRWMSIPDDVNGGTMLIRLKLWQLNVGADMLGSNSMTPFQESAFTHHARTHLHTHMPVPDPTPTPFNSLQESPSAHVLCRQCCMNRSLPGAYNAYSFLRQDTPGVHVPKRRTWPDLLAILTKCRDPNTSAAERKSIMAAEGIKRLFFAMDPNLVPHVNPCEDHLQDGLHLFGDGLLRSHGAWMFYVLNKLGLEVESMNAAVRAYKGFPRDVRIPKLHDGLTTGCRGVKGILPRSEAVLRMTGSEVHHFALHRCVPCLPTTAPHPHHATPHIVRGDHPR